MKLIKAILITMALSSVCSGASGCNPSSNITSVPAAVFQKDIQSYEPQLVDVRTPEEYGESHIKDAVNIDVQSDDFQDKATKLLVKNKPVYVYCRSGKRSLHAAEILAKEGYKVVNLNGGIIEWTDSKLPVVADSIKQ